MWLIWLLGLTSPVKACPRPQRFPTGLGATISSRNGPSRNVSNPGPASISSQPIAASDHAPEYSSAKTSKAPRRRSSGNRSIQEHHLSSLPEKPYDFPVPPGIGLGSMDCSRSTLAERMRKINTAKTAAIHYPDSHHPISPQDEGSTRLLDASLNDYRFLFPMPSSLQSVPLRLPPPPIDSRDSAPVNLPFGAIPLPPRPIHPNPPSSSPQTSGIPYVTKVRARSAVLGMPLDDNKVGGTRGSFSKILEPPPSPSCSLVMETLPRKFRTGSFISDWLSQFPFKPRRYDLAQGKIFFEFETERDALLAWNSPRMGGLEGLFGVRLFWYRVPPQKDMDTIRKVKVTGTIENSVQSRLQPVSDRDSSTDDFGHRLGHESGFKADLAHSNILSQKAASPPLSRPPSTVIEEDSGVSVDANTPAEGSRSNSDTQKSHDDTSEHFSGGVIVPSPTVTTSPLAAPTALSDHPNDRMAANYPMIGDLPPGGVPGFIPGAAIAPPTVIFTSLDPSSSSPRTSPSTFPTFSPEVVDPVAITTFADHQAPPALNQGLMQPSISAAETLHGEMEVDGIEFEKVDGTPLGGDDYMETTDTVALAKEQALREMVLRSRKRKFLEPPSTKQPTSTTTSTATSRNALEDLAANFIADAIARPRPAKIVKITPSSSAMAAWGKRLEKHVESSKAIMAKIQLTRSKAERNRLLAVLREKDRCVSR